MITTVKRICVVAATVVLSLGALTSCATLFPSVEENTVTVSRERVGAAISLLGSDMVNGLAETKVEPSEIYDILPASYKAYSHYIPSYQDLQDLYLSEIGKFGYDKLLSYLPEVTEDVKKLSRNPMPYVSGDNSLSLRLRQDLYSTFKSRLLSYLKESNAQLLRSFESSKKNFIDIQKAYSNLSSVGVSYNLPSPSMVSVDDLAASLTDLFFSKMEWYEKLLKNTPAEAGTLYTVFWED